MIISHPGMTAIRLRVISRTLITGINPPTLPARRRHLTIPALRSPAKASSPRCL
jgi:hypothetical protein